MRLWTLHPIYLDAKGLVALWREALLAQKVLHGSTKGYRHHPQLQRFRATSDPRAAIASYLIGVFAEAKRRNYAFDASKIGSQRFSNLLDETKGQLLYEWKHLHRKLYHRDRKRHRDCILIQMPKPHPLFRIVAGVVQEWERIDGKQL